MVVLGAKSKRYGKILEKERKSTLTSTFLGSLLLLKTI
jgi:hypothetical protein